MKKLSKIGLLLIALALLCAGLVMSVSGAEGQEGLVSYVDQDGAFCTGSLAEAVEYCAPDSEITLLGNCELDEKIVVRKNLTVNIGKYKLVSTDVSAFEIGVGKSLYIRGEGAIFLDGCLATSSATDVVFVIEGDAGTKGIDITHNGYANNRIVYAENGDWTFKNINVYSDATGKNWNSFFEMKNNNTDTAVNFTFDTVAFEHDKAYVSHPGQFITNVAGTGHLTIKNCGFRTEHSAIKSGYTDNNDNIDRETILIENSLISCSTNSTAVKNTTTTRNYVILGMDDSWKGSPKGTVNIYGSHLEANYRVLCYENVSGPIENNIINIYDSTVKMLGLNGNDDSENISRAVMLNTYGNSAIIARKNAIVGSTGGKQGWLTATAGTRTNLRLITKSVSDSAGMRVIESIVENLDETTGEVLGVTVNYKASPESEKYVWVYDPVGNADAPYVLVERTYETVNGEVVETTDTGPDYYKHAGFETYRFFNLETEVYTEYVLRTDTVTQGNWEANEPFGQTLGKIDQKNKMDAYHWSTGDGTYLIAGTPTNRYMKYWIEPDEVNPDALTRNLKSDAFWVIGGMTPFSNSDFNAVETRVFGEKRKSVMVVDFDFGTDTGIYPNVNFQFTSRAKTSDTKFDSNYSPSSWLEIEGNGNVKNHLGTTGTTLTDVPEVKLNDVNEWNHLSVVFYTDPAYEGGLAYVYLNGELIGTQTYYTEAHENLYLGGPRINIPKGQNVNGSFCLDNLSMRCYTDYQYEGECDSYVDADTSETVDVKTPEKYIMESAPGTYINEVAAVAGNTYRGADLSTLKEAAEAAGTQIRLLADFYSSVNEDVNIYTSGYEMAPTADSYAANIIYDIDGVGATYMFNEKYNNLSVKYYWYIGEYGNYSQMADINNRNYYVQTEFAPGQLPTYEGAGSGDIKDLENLIYKIHKGWHSAGDESVVENILPVTISMALAQDGEPICMYPSYDYVPATVYVKDSEGNVVDIALGDEASSLLFASLKPGQTFVVCSDFQLADNYYNKIFKADAATYGGGVTTSDSTEKKVINYTEAELSAMKAASAKMALDLNGNTITLGHASKRGSLICVDSNVTFSVYSSVPGGMIRSVQGQVDNTTIYGNRILDIYNGSENANSKYNTSNAHLVVGTVEIDGTTIPGSNLTLYGAVLVEGRTGDNSCSIEVDGITAIRHSTDSSGAFMTRHYDGTMTVTNTKIIAPTSSNVIDILDYDSSSYKHTPYVTFANCIILNNGKAIFKGTGDDEDNVCVTLENVITNGLVESKNNQGKLLIKGGVMGASLHEDGKYSTTYDSGVVRAKYNAPMTLNGITDTGIYEVIVPQKTDAETIVYDALKIYFVEAGKEKLVPTDSNVEIITLPSLEYASALSTECVSVKFMGLDGSVYKEEAFIKGGLPAAVTIPDYQLSDISTLIHTGKFDKTITNVTANTVYTPEYEVVNNVTGIKWSVSFYTSFNINVYVPYEYKSYFKRASANGVSLELTDVTVDGVQYVMCSAPVTPDNFASTVNFTVEFDEISGGVIYNGKATVSAGVMKYAEEILSDETGTYAQKDKTLVYAALTYANEAIEFIKGETDDNVAALTEKYSSFAGEDTSDKYTEAFDKTNLSAAFLKATVRLNSAPAFIFTVRKDFVGQITINVGGTEISHMVNDNTDRIIVISGLSVADFTADMTVTVEGRIGNKGIVITDGQYNLATYAAYHVENANYSDSDIPTDHQIKSRKALSLIDAIYAYSAAAKAYVAE